METLFIRVKLYKRVKKKFSSTFFKRWWVSRGQSPRSLVATSEISMLSKDQEGRNPIFRFSSGGAPQISLNGPGNPAPTNIHDIETGRAVIDWMTVACRMICKRLSRAFFFVILKFFYGKFFCTALRVF